MRLLFSLLIISLLWVVPAKAHPHAWIDMQTSLVFNEKGEITGLRVGWLFDEFYSAFSMEGVEPTQKALRELAAINLNNLLEYDYFTKVEVDGKIANYQHVSEYDSKMIGNRMWMDFLVPLEKPINPKTSDVIYSVYDPTFYVEILHFKATDAIQLEGSNIIGCEHEMIEPEPAEEMALFAASLALDENPDIDLGKFFAQKVALSCP